MYIRYGAGDAHDVRRAFPLALHGVGYMSCRALLPGLELSLYSVNVAAL